MSREPLQTVVSVGQGTNARRAWVVYAARCTGIAAAAGALGMAIGGLAYGATLGAVSVVAIGGVTSVQLARTRRIHRLLARVEDPRDRAAALEELRALTVRLRAFEPGDTRAERRYAAFAIAAAPVLHGVGVTKEAEDLDASVPDAWLAPDGLVARRFSRAVYRLRAGDHAGARAALEAVPQSPRDAMIALVVCLTDARLLVHEGRAREALERVPPDEPSWPSRIRESAYGVRAHALAAQGDLGAARAMVRALHALGGDRAIEAFVRVDGPATPLVGSALASDEAPYRS